MEEASLLLKDESFSMDKLEKFRIKGVRFVLILYVSFI